MDHCVNVSKNTGSVLPCGAQKTVIRTRRDAYISLFTKNKVSLFTASGLVFLYYSNRVYFTLNYIGTIHIWDTVVFA